MFWNDLLDKRVARYDAKIPRDLETGIMEGAAPRTLGPENINRAVLFVHGFSGTPNNFHDLPDQVAAAGWRVRVMLLPGHGTSPREFERTTAAQLRQSVLDELAALRKHCKTVVLVGHSMGGALVTLTAAEAPVDGLILASPYYGITRHWYFLLPPETLIKTFSPLVRWVYTRPEAQPVNRKEVARDILSYHWLASNSGLTAMSLAEQANTPEVVSKIVVPTLLIHSACDSVAAPKAAARVFGAFPATDKKAVWLETSDHVIFWDYERKKVTSEALTFLERIGG